MLSLVVWAASVPSPMPDEGPFGSGQYVLPVSLVSAGGLHLQVAEQEPQNGFDADPACWHMHMPADRSRGHVYVRAVCSGAGMPVPGDQLPVVEVAQVVAVGGCRYVPLFRAVLDDLELVAEDELHVSDPGGA